MSEASDEYPFSRSKAKSKGPLPLRDEIGTLGKLKAYAESLERGDLGSDEEKWLALQSKSLVAWAAENECLVDTLEFRRIVGDFDETKEGQEHRVVPVRPLGRMFKVTKRPYFGCNGTLPGYLENLIRSNILFADDNRLEGILESEEGASIIISQRFIVGKHPTEDEIAEWFGLQGYVPHGKYGWRHPASGTVIRDAHIGNLIKMKSGTLIPIDLQIINLGDLSLLPDENR